MKTKRRILATVLIACLFMLPVTMIAEAGRTKDVQLTQPDPANYNGMIIKVGNPCVADLLSVMWLGEMHIIINSDGTQTGPTFVAMHFFTYQFQTSNLGITSLKMDSFDKHTLTGTVIQNSVSYPVTGTYMNIQGNLAFSLNWNSESYTISLFMA